MALAALLSAAVVALNEILADEDSPSAPAAGNFNLPRGLRNNNPGNLVKSDTTWTGKVAGTDSRFETFSERYYGTRALVKNLRLYRTKHKLTTVAGIINRWAPPVENNTSAYVTAVANALKVTPTAQLPDTAAVYAELAWQIARHENGGAEMDKHYPRAAFIADATKAFNT